MTNIKIKTKGMHCQSCEALLNDSLEALDGVDRSEASHKSGIVSVDFDEAKVSEKSILEIIKLEGYDIK